MGGNNLCGFVFRYSCSRSSQDFTTRLYECYIIITSIITNYYYNSISFLNGYRKLLRKKVLIIIDTLYVSIRLCFLQKKKG